MMKLEKLSAIAEILSAIAIVVTLAYLAIQTQQNTEAIQANTRQAMLAADQDLLTNLAMNPQIDENYYKGQLTDDEARTLSIFLTMIVRVRENNWLQYRSGSVDEQTWSAYQGSLLGTLSSTRTRNWWNNVMNWGIFDAEFVEEIDALLVDMPVANYDYHAVAFEPQ